MRKDEERANKKMTIGKCRPEKGNLKEKMNGFDEKIRGCPRTDGWIEGK